MKKLLGVLAIGGIIIGCSKILSTPSKSVEKPANLTEQQSIHKFKVEGLLGDEIDFSQYKGKKILVVNTASKCGLTPQYADLQKLYEQFSDKLVIVGFPADNFAHQEPGTNSEIGEFCQKNYGVKFPMAAKVSVKGNDQAEIFKFLTKKELNGVSNNTIMWNFTKFLLDENGHLIRSFNSMTSPTSPQITKYL